MTAQQHTRDLDNFRDALSELRTGGGMQPHGGLSELGSRAAGWRRHVAIARCGCGLRPSLRPSRRKPSSTSVSPRRARSSPLSVFTRICPGSLGSAPRMKIKEPKPITAPSFVVFPASDRFRVAVAAQKRRNAGVRRSAD